MLVIKLILSITLLLINKSNWYLSFALLLSNPLLPIIYSYIVSSNYFLGSNDIMTNSMGLALYGLEKACLYAYAKINDWFEQPNIKDNFFMKITVSCLFFIYRCLKYIDDVFKAFIVKQIINVIKFITFNAILYVKSNPEQLQKILNQSGRPIDAKFICSMIPDPYLLSESLKTNSLQNAYDNDIKKINEQSNPTNEQSTVQSTQSNTQNEQAQTEQNKSFDQTNSTDKINLANQIDPMYQMPFFATNFLFQNPNNLSSMLNLSKSIKNTIDQTNKNNSNEETEKSTNVEQINLHQVTNVMQSNIKFINYVKELLLNENVKLALQTDPMICLNLENKIKETEQKINLFLIKCKKQQKENKTNKTDKNDQSNINKFNLLSEIKSDNKNKIQISENKANTTNQINIANQSNATDQTISSDNETSRSNSDEFHIVDQIEPVD